MRQLHPLRLQYEMLSHANPFMRPLRAWTEEVRRDRRAIPADNVFWQAQEQFADWMEATLDACREVRDRTAEAWFHAVYGSPLVQALVGLKAADGSPRRRPADDPVHKAFVAQRVEELIGTIADGGPREAAIRALLYVRLPEGVVDERGFNLLQRMRDEAGGGLTLAAFKKLVREQFFMLMLDERRAVDAIPAMLARDPELASRMACSLHEVTGALGLRTDLGRARLSEVAAFFASRRSERPSRLPTHRQKAPSHAERTSKH
jgi:hypothetical protein